ncbi:unnamed protein product [Discosporangium mesarthrocarpum]
MPMPNASPRAATECFWQSDGRAMRYETQAHILRMLDLLCRHFTAAALSMKVGCWLTWAGEGVGTVGAFSLGLGFRVRAGEMNCNAGASPFSCLVLHLVALQFRRMPYSNKVEMTGIHN